MAETFLKKNLQVLSYNIHKGVSSTNLRSTISEIKDLILSVDADVVCLQELRGAYKAVGSQLEFIADTIWPHFAYGRNAVYNHGHHGNALMSKFPISGWENLNISASKLENRGLLHAEIQIPHWGPLHLMNTHLGLRKNWRSDQLKNLCRRIDGSVGQTVPLILCGDFNDWDESASDFLHRHVKLSEAHLKFKGAHGKTFPSRFPLLSLDRIYFRNIDLKKAQIINGAGNLAPSDHLPICAEFQIGTAKMTSRQS